MKWEFQDLNQCGSKSQSSDFPGGCGCLLVTWHGLYWPSHTKQFYLLFHKQCRHYREVVDDGSSFKGHLWTGSMVAWGTRALKLCPVVCVTSTKPWGVSVSTQPLYIDFQRNTCLRHICQVAAGGRTRVLMASRLRYPQSGILVWL